MTTTSELRLYVIAVLATVYVVAWRAIGAHERAAPVAPASVVSSVIQTARSAPRQVRTATPHRRVRTRSS